MGVPGHEDSVAWDRVRPAERDTVQADLEVRLRHTDGVGMTLGESIAVGRVVGKSIVPQGRRRAYAVVEPDTSTPPTVRSSAHVQVRKATWEVLDLPRTQRHLPDDGPLDTVSAPAISTFTVRSSRDAASREREGQEVVAANALDDATMEVQFRDGQWLLCSPDELDQSQAGGES